jgi:predicted transcriptional regulator
MRSKPAARSSRHRGSKRAKRGGARKATTFRLDPRFQKGLTLLGEVRRVPLNRLVNEAVGEYLDAHAATVEAELEETLRRVKAYRQVDPGFESAISKFAEAEAELAADDPVEGQTTRAKGPAQRLVRELIRG